MIQECHRPLGYGRVSTDQGLEVRTPVSGFLGSGSDLLVIIIGFFQHVSSSVTRYCKPIRVLP